MKLIYDIFIDKEGSSFHGHSVSRACTHWFTRRSCKKPLKEDQHIQYWRDHYTSANDSSGDNLGHKDLNINEEYTSELRFHLTDPKTKFCNEGFSLEGGKEFSGELEVKRDKDKLVVVTMKGMPKGEYKYTLDIRPDGDECASDFRLKTFGVLHNGDRPR